MVLQAEATDILSSHSFCFVFLPVLHFARVSETIVSVKWNLDPCTASPNPPSTSIRAIARRFAQDYEGNSRRQPENWTGPNASTGPSSASIFKEKQDEHWKSPTHKCLGYWHSHQQANGVNVFDKTINSRFHEGGLEAPQSLNVLENVRAWRIRSAEKKCSCILTFSLEKYFHNFLWYTVTEKIFTNVLIDVFTNILRAAFKVYSYSFIFTDYNHNSVITTSQISEYSGDYYTRVGLNLVH